MRLHRRLTLAMAVLLVIGLGVADVVTYTSLRSFLYGRLDAQLSSSQALAVRMLVRFERHGDAPTIEAVDDRISDDVYVLVIERTGTTLVTRPSGSPLHPTPRPVVPRTVRLSLNFGGSKGPYRPNPYNFTLQAPDGARYRAAAARVPQGTVFVAVPLRQTVDTMTSLVRIEGGVSAAVLLALCALALWTVRRGLRPLDDMARTAGAIASGDLSRRVEPAEDETEVGRLGLALNAMLAQIEHAFAEKSESEARLRQFVADASHELRTPLTSIRGYVELLRIGALGAEDDRARALGRVEHEAVRMGRLVDDLLLLARLDQGRPLERQPVDLCRVAREALDDARIAAPDRRIELVARAAVAVAGDRDRLAQVVHNLVGNALVHTPEGTPVQVEVIEERGRGVLRVLDEGPGLSAAARERVFDRFYRGDASRSRGGTGLGLAIVRAIADALDGRAWVEARTDRSGTVFCVEIPLAAAPPLEDPGRPPTAGPAAPRSAAGPGRAGGPAAGPDPVPVSGLAGGPPRRATTRRGPGAA